MRCPASPRRSSTASRCSSSAAASGATRARPTSCTTSTSSRSRVPSRRPRSCPPAGADLYDVVRRACRIARSGTPGPVFVEVPADQYLFRHDTEIVPPLAEPSTAPPAESVERAAEILRAAKRPLLYVGLGAAKADLVSLAERLEAPVSTTFQGKGVFPESHPLSALAGLRRRRAGVRARRRRFVRRHARDRLPLRRGRDGQLRHDPSAPGRPRGHRPGRARPERPRGPRDRGGRRRVRRGAPPAPRPARARRRPEGPHPQRPRGSGRGAREAVGRARVAAPPPPRPAGDVRARDGLHVRQRQRDVPRRRGPAPREARPPPRARRLLVHGLRGPRRHRREARAPRVRRSSRSRATARSS